VETGNVDLRAREGDFIETSEGLIFDVKGLIHPPNRIVAFLRYFPGEEGKRKRNGTSYRKVYSLTKRYVLLMKKYPQYLFYDPIFDEKLCEVTLNAVKKHYKPAKNLRELHDSNKLDETETLALQLSKLVKETAGIPWNTIGISGSIMVGIHMSSSDIDPIIYGSENCKRVYSALKELLSKEQEFLNPYTRKELETLFKFRSKDTIMDYEDFVRTESRKVLQGKFLQREYFIRFVKDWSEFHEKYGDVKYTNVGYARVKATVVDDSESIFTPCTYKISNVCTLEGQQKRPLKEITSFRGRFCEQAREGEVIIAQGKVERVKHLKENIEYFRLLLGNKPSDFMILA
jgi:hypothetical protein